MKSVVQEANSHEAQLEYGILFRFSRALQALTNFSELILV